jgi:hypothetical protein
MSGKRGKRVTSQKQCPVPSDGTPYRPQSSNQTAAANHKRFRPQTGPCPGYRKSGLSEARRKGAKVPKRKPRNGYNGEMLVGEVTN